MAVNQLTREEIEEIEYAFYEIHMSAYWSDSNPRPPAGHNKDLEDCNDPDCVIRKDILAKIRAK